MPALARANAYSGSLVEAQGYLNRRDYAKAEGLFREYVVRKDLRREATLGLAAALNGQGKAPEASALLGEYLASSPMDVAALMLQSDMWMAQGLPDRAQKELSRVRVLRATQEGLEEKSALVKAALGQKADAVKALEALRSAGKLSQTSFPALARLQLESGNAVAAESVLADFDKQFSASAESHLLMAKALEAQKKLPESEVSYRRAIQAGQGIPAYWLAYGEFLQGQKRAPESRKIMESALALDPASSELQLKVAEAYELSDDHEAAVKAFSHALSQSPGNDKAMYGIVRVEEKRGAMDQVGARLQAWSKKYPEKSWVVLSYARLLMAIGQPARATEALAESLKEVPGQAEVRDFLVRVKDAPASFDAMEPEVAEPPSPRAVASFGEIYVVKEGDLLGTISAKVYGTSKHWRRILDANRDKLQSPDGLSTGMKLKIPALKGPKRQPETRKETKARIYVVKKREMLSRISTKVYGTAREWRRIFDANRRKLRRPSSVYAGMKLVIPPLNNEAEVLAEVAAAEAQPEMVMEETISFMSAAPEKKNNSLLVSPESVQLPSGSPRLAPALPVTEEHAEAPSPPRTVDAGFRFSLQAAPVREQVKLEAGGFSSNLPAKLGYQAGAELGYQLESLPLVLAARIDYSRTKFDGLTAVAPASVTIQRKRYSLLARMQPASFPKLSFLAGYGWSRREVTETTPRAVVTNRNTAGVLLGVNYNSELTESLGGEARLELFLPHSHEETGVTTGFHHNSFAAELATGISHSIGKSATASLSLSARYEQSSYGGTGTRGSINGKDSDWIFSLPMQVRF